MRRNVVCWIKTTGIKINFKIKFGFCWRTGTSQSDAGSSGKNGNISGIALGCQRWIGFTHETILRSVISSRCCLATGFLFDTPAKTPEKWNWAAPSNFRWTVSVFLLETRFHKIFTKDGVRDAPRSGNIKRVFPIPLRSCRPKFAGHSVFGYHLSKEL